jgi:hypothetical protein
MHRLDDYGLHRVGCLKIDVEGHEEAVLEGARETLRTSRPNVIVELQEDRNPGRIAAVQKRLEALELHGFFLYQQELHPIEDFDPGLHQNRARIPYVVNFVFVQPPVAAKLRAQYRL